MYYNVNVNIEHQSAEVC